MKSKSMRQEWRKELKSIERMLNEQKKFEAAALKKAREEFASLIKGYNVEVRKLEKRAAILKGRLHS